MNPITPSPPPQFDVALSFAGEDRAYVQSVAEALRAHGVVVFYDAFEEADLWGKNLYEHLTEIYLTRARFTVMFISKYYASKAWPTQERRAAQARALAASTDYVLPARFDDSEVPGLLPTVAFVDLRTHTPAQVSDLVLRKLGRDPLATKANAVPSPQSPSLAGEVEFDFSAHDGRHRIGAGQFEFETKWSRGGKTEVHCYNDPPSIHGIALLPHGAQLGSLRSADGLDFTSRTQLVGVGECVVLRNVHGLYAAVEVVSIKDRRHGDTADALRLRYRIRSDGACDFSVSEGRPPPKPPAPQGVTSPAKSSEARSVEIVPAGVFGGQEHFHVLVDGKRVHTAPEFDAVKLALSLGYPMERVGSHDLPPMEKCRSNADHKWVLRAMQEGRSHEIWQCEMCGLRRDEFPGEP